MIENRRGLTIFSHTMLILGIAVILFPLYVAFVAATLDDRAVFETPMTLLPGTQLLENIKTIWVNGVGVNSAPFWLMMLNSFIMAFSITVGKITVSMLSAFAIVWFRFPLRNLFFWMIFITLMLPVEVRIFPTVEVIANLKMLNSYAGLTLPLMASATATFLFRQFFMTLPDDWWRRPVLTARRRCAFSATSCCRCQKPTWRRYSSSPLSTAGTSICGRC